MKLTTEQIEELAAEGTLELADGRTLTIIEHPDYDTQIGDFDCYGQIEICRTRNSWGNYIRPAHFDGMAEIITTHHGDRVWWQPYSFTKADRRQWHTDADYRRNMRSQVRNILEFGFMTYELAVSETCHGCNRPHIIDQSFLGGFEPFLSDADKIGVVHDLLSFLTVEITATDA